MCREYAAFLQRLSMLSTEILPTPALRYIAEDKIVNHNSRRRPSLHIMNVMNVLQYHLKEIQR
jgi:hypothetical protein